MFFSRRATIFCKKISKPSSKGVRNVSSFIKKHFYIQDEHSFDRERIFELLKLKSFSAEEFEDSYDLIFESARKNDIQNENPLKTSEISHALLNIVKDDLFRENHSFDSVDYQIKAQTKQIESLSKLITLNQPSDQFEFDIYRDQMTKIAEKLDSRMLTMAASFLIVGSSIGIIIPCMPMMVKELGILPSQFGFVISSFGISKLIGNIPCAYLVDKYGRKPMMIGGFSLCTVGIGSLGLALIPSFGLPWLVGCRLVTGLGVSAFTSGAFMYLMDISTPLNRTRTNSPVMASFQTGNTLGPAVGGWLIDSQGITKTYGLVGGLFVLQTLMNSWMLPETMRKPLVIPTPQSSPTTEKPSLPTSMNGEGREESPSNQPSNQLSNHQLKTDLSPSIRNSFQIAFSHWRSQLKHPKLTDTFLFNYFYWMAFSGSQLTLLPIFMVDSLHFSPTEIGACFASSAIVSVLSSQPIAYLADKYGKVPVILAGSSLVSLSMMSLPFVATSFPTLLGCLLPLAVGANALGSVPLSRLPDLVPPHESRSQAQSLFRVFGDLGLIAGAIGSGYLAHLFSVQDVILGNGALFSAAIAVLGWRNVSELISKPHSPSPSSHHHHHHHQPNNNTNSKIHPQSLSRHSESPDNSPSSSRTSSSDNPTKQSN